MTPGKTPSREKQEERVIGVGVASAKEIVEAKTEKESHHFVAVHPFIPPSTLTSVNPAIQGVYLVLFSFSKVSQKRKPLSNSSFHTFVDYNVGTVISIESAVSSISRAIPVLLK